MGVGLCRTGGLPGVAEESTQQAGTLQFPGVFQLLDQLWIGSLVVGNHAEAIPGRWLPKAGSAEIACLWQWKAAAWTGAFRPRQFGLAFVAQQGMMLYRLVAEQAISQQRRVVSEAL